MNEIDYDAAMATAWALADPDEHIRAELLESGADLRDLSLDILAGAGHPPLVEVYARALLLVLDES